MSAQAENIMSTGRGPISTATITIWSPQYDCPAPSDLQHIHHL